MVGALLYLFGALLKNSQIVPPVEEKAYQNTRGVGSGEPLTELPPEAERDELFQRLMRGDITGYASQSSADFALIMKLLHWTGDSVELTRRLFLQSGLYRQDKTERKTGSTTYLDMTIHNALKKRRNPPMRCSFYSLALLCCLLTATVSLPLFLMARLG